MDYEKNIRVKIEDELMTVVDVCGYGFGDLQMVEMDNGEEYYIANLGDAEKAVYDYWKDMARNDKREFTCIIGEERLVQWALGESDSFGIDSLEEFCKINADYCEETLATYDSNAREVKKIGHLIDILDLKTDEGIYAFRCN